MEKSKLRGLAATGGVMAPKVIAVNGYAKRFLVGSYRVWVAAAASAAGAPGDG